MKIEIFDVGHGACAVVTSPNGKKMMVDCGHDDEKRWWPSVHYAGQEIEALFITNYDEDHVSDLQGLMKYVGIKFIYLNTSVTYKDIKQLKHEHGMGDGIACLQQWMQAWHGKAGSGLPDMGPVQFRLYHNNYPRDFEDENNLSLVLFVEYSDFKIVFPGDLETAGWKKLLERDDFRQELSDVNIFVASHHGRQSGCCADVFQYCHPQIIIMSDTEKLFDTQETYDWYRNNSGCAGIDWGLLDRKYVFTTRKNGKITIDVGLFRWSINVEKFT